MKNTKAVTALILYISIYVAIYFIHISFFNVDVVFYASLFDGFIASILTAGILLLPFYSLFNNFEKLLLLVIYFLVGYALSISVPTVIDRSLSFYFLEKIDQRSGIKLNRFENVFTKEYAREHRLVDVRLTEQLASGTIIIENGCVKLTKRGKLLASFSRYFRQNFLPKQRLLMGEYTDALTDPFHNSMDQGVDYKCK